MTVNPKPGNQPDPDDMSGAFEKGGDAHKGAAPGHDLEQEEEEAAKLGDFA